MSVAEQEIENLDNGTRQALKSNCLALDAIVVNATHAATEFGRQLHLVEICTTSDSPLAQAVTDAGGNAERYSH